MSFYSDEEFKAQLEELVVKGIGWADASAIVRQREVDDEKMYQQWLDQFEHTHADTGEQMT